MIAFSIITAFFEGNKYISTLIGCAEHNVQTLKNSGIDAVVELIIVNDSPDIAVQLPQGKSTVPLKVINHEVNSGIHQARVTGLKQCTGDFVVFLDQDDELADDCLLEEYRAIGDADVAVANAYIENSDGTKKVYFKTKGQYINAFDVNTYIKAHNQIVSPGHCLIRKSSIPKEWTEYIMKTRGSDDLFLWILMLYQKCKFVACKKVVYTHRYTGSNLSLEEAKMAASSIEVAEFMRQIEYVPDKAVDAFVRNRRGKIALQEKRGLEKLLICIRNSDIYAPRIWWIVRRMIF